MDRAARYAPYGYNDEDVPWANASPVVWDYVDWGSLQEQCVEKNHDRYDAAEKEPREKFWYPIEEDTKNAEDFQAEKQRSERVHKSGEPRYKQRTAVLYRIYRDLKWQEDIIYTIRAMVMELNLHSGGEYTVFLMMEVPPIENLFRNPKVYDSIIETHVPPEFRNMTILFNMDLVINWYPSLAASTGIARYRMNQPYQLFTLLHPEFDFVWMMEADVRYTGSWYELFESAESWSRAQPRKMSWERAAEYYIPSLYGTYANFSRSIQDKYPDGGVWGATETILLEHGTGPTPSTPHSDQDNYSWGVGEDADLIPMSPVVYAQNMPLFREDPVAGMPAETKRLVTVPSVARWSKYALRTMHSMQIVQGTQVVPEFYAYTIGEINGLKIAAFPTPYYYSPIKGVEDGAEKMQEVFNDFKDERSPYKSQKPQVNIDMFDQMTYWWVQDDWRIQHSSRLYRKWYGLSEIPGEEIGGDRTYPGMKRMCLPGVLMHPVKDTS